MLLIFDCDGVVIDSMRLHTEVESRIYESIGIKISALELEKRFAGIPLLEEFKILENETGHTIPIDTLDRMENEKAQIFIKHLKPISYIQQTLDALDGIPRCIASGSSIKGLNFTLRHVNLLHRFSPNIYSSDMVKRGKPFPDLFLFAAQEMNMDPRECVVIEDGAAGIRAGLKAGMKVLGFSGGSHCDEHYDMRLKEAGADIVFSDMRQLSKHLEKLGA